MLKRKQGLGLSIFSIFGLIWSIVVVAGVIFWFINLSNLVSLLLANSIDTNQEFVELLMRVFGIFKPLIPPINFFIF